MEQYQSNVRHNIIGGLLGTFVLGSASYAATFLKALGGTDLHFAMLNALPAMIAVIALIPGAMLIDSAKNKLKTVLIVCLVSRLFFLLYAVVPLLPPVLRPLALVFLIGLRNAPESIWLIGYQSLIGDVFPMDQLNEIIGQRNKYNSLLTIGATFLLGIFLSLNERFAIRNLTLFEILFVFTFLVGLTEIHQYRQFAFLQKPPARGDHLGKKLLGIIKTLPKQPQYVRYCSTVIVFYLGWQMAWPLYSIYQLNVLQANAAWIGYFTIVSTITQVITIELWIRLSRKIGSQFVLGICMFLMAISPCVYALSATLPMLLLAQIVVGSGTGGVIFLVFNELLYVCPQENRTLYISLFTCLTQITGSVMPFVGIYIKQLWSIYAALYLSAAIRLIGAVIFLWASNRNQRKTRKIQQV
ncbi:MAG: MFS transporter [Negativicutes bacterium]|nr:MFS transporter [Negativicutes bacterium]